MIDLYTLEQLVTFAQCGTLLATAERLHISQPALSQAMKRLERQMGVRVHMVEGSYENIKITTPEDLDIAEVFAKQQRTGRF